MMGFMTGNKIMATNGFTFFFLLFFVGLGRCWHLKNRRDRHDHIGKINMQLI